MRYVVLVGLVEIGALATGSPIFCKLCPAGTLGAGIPQVILRPFLRQMIGPLYWIKVGLLAVLVLVALFVKRPFCRFLCPLGAVYSPFNRVSLMRMRVDYSACTKCNACKHVCPVDIAIYEDPDSDACIRCLECTRCPAVSVAYGPTKPEYPLHTAGN
jgi:polyferredoxin